ncbi:MAG: C39 family peptidase [Huintestinicola sp.]
MIDVERSNAVMKYGVLCVILGIAVVISAASYDYVCENEVYSARLSEKLAYAQLDADMNKRYSGYTVNDLCTGYDKPESFLGKVTIPMDVTNQYPELPVGCEVTCAAALLNFLGFDIDKCALTDNYLPISDGSFTEHDGILYGPDPSEFFVGDPYGKGYGCYKEVIADMMNDYFLSHGSDNKAVILEDSNAADLERLIDGGVPVIVWASIDMKPYRYRDMSVWQTESGKAINWLANSHTLILTGYDTYYYYFMDCNDKAEIQRYPKDSFLVRWDENGKQAVAVKLP